MASTIRDWFIAQLELGCEFDKWIEMGDLWPAVYKNGMGWKL